MEIQLSAQATATIQERIAAGINKTPDEVVDEAVILLAKQDETRKKMTGLRHAIQAGMDSGPPVPWDTENIIKLAQSIRDGDQ